MNARLLRWILAGLLLATIASRIQAFPAVPHDPTSRVADFLSAQGLTVREQPVVTQHKSVHFAAPGCNGVLQAMVMGLSLEAVPYFETVVGPGYVHHYIYFGEISRAPNPMALRASWIKHRALSLLGLRGYTMHRTLLLVAEPPGCNVIKRIDWRPLWNGS
jgi:hypothetical protein